MHFFGESCLTLKFFQCVKEMHFYTQCFENQQKYLIWIFHVVKGDFLRDFQTMCLFLAEQLTDWSDNLFPYFLAGYGYFWGSLPPNWNGAKSLRFLHCRRFSSGAKIRRNGGEDPRSKTIHQTGQWNGAENQHRHQRKFQFSYCKMRYFHEFSNFPDIFAGNWRDKRDGISRKKVPASRFPDFQFPGKKRNTRQAFIRYFLT